MESRLRGNVNIALALSLAVLLFIAGGIAGYFLLKQQQDAEMQPVPAYVNLGRVVAQVNGGRFIRTEVQLEIISSEYSGLFQTQHVQVLESVRRGFGQVSSDEIYTLEGKRAAQTAIIEHLNFFFGKPLVQGVYFSDFLIAGG